MVEGGASTANTTYGAKKNTESQNIFILLLEDACRLPRQIRELGILAKDRTGENVDESPDGNHHEQSDNAKPHKVAALPSLFFVVPGADILDDAHDEDDARETEKKRRHIICKEAKRICEKACK